MVNALVARTVVARTGQRRDVRELAALGRIARRIPAPLVEFHGGGGTPGPERLRRETILVRTGLVRTGLVRTDWCDPDWCDPCADTDAVDIKKLKEALKKASGDLDGDKAEKVIEQVIHAVRLARSFEAMRKKRWSQRGGRYGDCD